MAQQCESPKTFTSAEALAVWRRVKLSSGSGVLVEYADEGDYFIGVSQAGVAITKQVAVKDHKHPGTQKVVASKAISEGADIYGADDGKVSDAVSGSIIGIALEAALADGDVIEAILDMDKGETWS